MNTVEARFQGRLGHFELDAAFSVPARGITALFGPSGCGKTTVLRCMAGLTNPGQGRLTVGEAVWQSDRVRLPPHRRAVGYVFQEPSLFPHLTVRGNLDYGYRRARRGASVPAYDTVMEMLGLGPLLPRSPVHLSGGERQRVAIARALMSGPEVLLMDEPLAALDRFAKNEILPYLQRLHDHLAIPSLYVSHDMAEVERLADHMVLMEHGRVRATGELKDLLADPNLPFARAPEAATVLDATVADYDTRYGLATLAVPGGRLVVPGELGATGTPRRLRVEASDVGLCQGPAPRGLSILNTPTARVVRAEHIDNHQTHVFLRLGMDGQGSALMARITRKSWESLGLSPGDPVTALIKGVSLVAPG